MRAAATVTATVLVLAGLALPAAGATRRTAPAKKGLPTPSYVIPNIAATGMCLAVLAIACKRFRRS